MNERVCYCGETEDEHDEVTGKCFYCECERFRENVEATLELREQNDDDEAL